jgi:hypothetical protein
MEREEQRERWQHPEAHSGPLEEHEAPEGFPESESVGDPKQMVESLHLAL